MQYTWRCAQRLPTVQVNMMAAAHVLVVEDEQDIRDFVAFALESEGYRVTTADNGAVALNEVAREFIDVVLLDMRMPVMNGWAFAEAYQEQPGRHAPIVVMTAAQDAATRAAQIKAEDYLAKPFDLDDLLNVIARHTRG